MNKEKPLNLTTEERHMLRIEVNTIFNRLPIDSRTIEVYTGICRNLYNSIKTNNPNL